MTIKIDGTNGVLQSYDYQVLTTGFTYTFAAGVTTLLIEPAGTLATGTITMPAAPADGMVVTFSSTQQITALTVAANTGQSIKGNSVQAIPNQPLSWVYRLTNTTWYAMAGGAARASNLVSGTSVATTSGTSIDFTGIPSWVKRITVMFSATSTNGTSVPILRLGTSSGIEATGYLGATSNIVTGSTPSSTNTTGLGLAQAIDAAAVYHGQVVITFLGSNLWVMAATLSRSDVALTTVASSSKTLSGTLDRVRITTVNGTDAFDAGSINILYE